MSRGALPLAIALVLPGCGGGPYADFPRVDPDSVVEPAPGSRTAEDAVRLRASACQSFDLTPEHAPIDDTSLSRFLERRGWQARKLRERSDLVYLDVLPPPGSPARQPIRLRVAILASAEAAGRELHEALLQQGRGAWGVHRGNVAVLAPGDDLDRVIGFLGASGLACWGVLTVAGRDDTFVIPGGYVEL